MISDLDSYKVARLMITRHGAQASQLAGGRAEALKFAGDSEGRNDWINVLDTIREMAAPVPVKPVLAAVH
jgi:hypothetical protein